MLDRAVCAFVVHLKENTVCNLNREDVGVAMQMWGASADDMKLHFQLQMAAR